MNTTLLVKIIWLINSILIIFLAQKIFETKHTHYFDGENMTHNMTQMNMKEQEKIVCENSFIKNKLENILDSYNKKNISANECHMKFHMFSRQLVKDCGLDFAQQNINYGCRNSMIHGIMEGFVLNNYEKKDYIFEAEKFCDNAYGSGIKYLECIHGIGNGVVVKNNYDIKKSYQECQILGDEKNICVSGIYGGYFRYKPQFQNPSFCKNQLNENMCLMYVGAFFDEKKYSEKSWCKLSSQKNACGYGLGVMYSRQVDSNPEKIEKVCQSSECLKGAIFEAGRIGKQDEKTQLEKYLEKFEKSKQ